MSSDPHHIPAEMLELLVDTIPHLFRGKQSVIEFFESVGTPKELTEDLRRRVKDDRTSISKFEITRTILIRLNQAGDAALRTRRQVIRRVEEWEDFSGCYPNSTDAAEAGVARVKKMRGTKDYFTKAADRAEEEARKARDARQQLIEDKEAKRRALDSTKSQLSAFYAASDPKRRGKELEATLNSLFKVEGILVRESFHLVGQNSEGIVEQIDGAIEIRSKLFLVEMKWYKEALGVDKSGAFLPKLFSRPDCGGIFIAEPGVTGPTIAQFRDAIIAGRAAIICELSEIFRLLQDEADIASLLRRKMEEAVLNKNPFWRWDGLPFT